VGYPWLTYFPFSVAIPLLEPKESFEGWLGAAYLVYLGIEASIGVGFSYVTNALLVF